MSIKTRLVDYREGEHVFEGRLAWDDAISEPRPGVIVAHTIRGRSRFEEDKAGLLAEMGYAGFAIDVYGKDAIGGDFNDCREMMESLRSQRELLQRRLLRAVRALRDQSEVDASRIAAIGYCFGGLCVLDIARTGEPLAGVVSFHGLFEPPGNTAGNRVRARKAGPGRRARRRAQQHGRRLAASLLRQCSARLHEPRRRRQHGRDRI